MSAISMANFVWSIADQLRGVYKPHQYGNIVLPFTILRRLDCMMEPHRDTMRELAKRYGDKPDVLAIQVKRKTDLPFHNTSEYDFARLMADPDGLADNLIDCVSRFSENIDVFERFKFAGEIATLAEKNRLLLVVRKFGEVDLHPDVMPNAEMGDLYEHLIYKFAEASNEEAGEHFTPRDAIRLMVDLLFAEDNTALLEPGVVRTVYDPTAGTGGMLSVSEDHLLALNPDARLRLYGQELNDQSYAICKSDMIGKGQETTNIRLGDTLADDKFAGRTFDYCLSNPPYGIDWKASEDAVKKERAATGKAGRFGPGLPSVDDGQMLFLLHLASKMRPDADGGGRAGIVLNGSPLFNGGAESGQSEIRRWLLENDLVDAIIAMPTNMFYNTGIATYIWILDNTKPADRRGKVQLIDATSFYSKMRKNLGDKNREMLQEHRERVVKLYDAFEEKEYSKVFTTDDFGYWTITVDRPLQRNYSAARITSIDDKKFGKSSDVEGLRAAVATLGDEVYTDLHAFVAALKKALTDVGLSLTAARYKSLALALSEPDDTAEIAYDKKGNPEPDTSQRDTEKIPFTYGGNDLGEAGRDATIKAFFEAEVLPHAPDAWIDHKKTKVGYEIPFTRHFYMYVPPRPLAEIDADLEAQVAGILTLLREVEQ